MTEEAELQARIAMIAGQIDEHKQHQYQSPTNTQHQHLRQYGSPSYRSRGRWSPYGRGAARAGYAQAHRNRTLVLSGAKSATPAADAPSLNATSMAPPRLPHDAFVSTRGPGANQLINKDVYNREMKQKLQHKERARTAKRQKVHDEDRAKLIHYVKTTPTPASHELVVDGIRFNLRDDGGKLIRIPDSNTANRETPKKVTIADVDFFRTTNGNLVRANAVRDLNRPIDRKKKLQCEHFTKHGTVPVQSATGPRSTKRHRTTLAGKIPRSSLTIRTGKCPFGPSCKFSHDADKVAICKDFLRTGECSAGKMCDMSHELTYHRVPACNHFLRSNCTNDACRYPHIHVSPSASVCRPFSLLGYCERGEECKKRHVLECPDYSNHGHCKHLGKGQCPLPHIDRASTLRKAAARQAKIGAEDESDLSSSEEEKPEDDTPSDDIDSDEFDIIVDSADGGSVSQQHDFIAFS